MCFHIKPSAQIGVNRGQVHPVIQWQKHRGHNEITQEKPNHHHVILETAKRIVTRRHLAYGTRHGDKSDATEAGAYHPEGDEPPFTFFVTNEKRLVIGVAAGVVRDYKQADEIGKYEQE